ncbi:type VI secretion protein ImpA [Pseudomonas sp. Leaf127]|uniref:type VI secretion system protein TssA n=1 Tax=Pseudomonas sp. Leaf127 TaxID=1736267 RepID=UPI0007030938|nr:type VI secretion system protein TssA [Pseudomonas sp. Leaf127]KQQ49206.1 type VI secretion protein ImpA [Pseudomonas sp. Leaf127]
MDVALLLSAVSADAPCGEDLEYDADFLQLERDAQGKPERVMGDAVQAAEPPAWRLIEQSASGLLQRSKDLRITHFLVQSAVALDGIAGLANTLDLIDQLLRQYWDTLYPLLDADDDNDPTLRINALAGLACDTNLRLLRESPLVRSRAFGTLSVRAALHAGGLQHASDESLSLEALGAALRDSDPQTLQDTHAALRQALQRAAAIEAFVNEHVGSEHGIDLAALKQPLRQALQVLGEHAPAAEAGTDDEVPAPQAADDAGTAQVQAFAAPAAPRPSAEINSREDVLRSLDRLLAYYARHEPSSPLPMLLNRAKSLVNADFEAIVRNLIPDGMSQFETLRGPEPD